MLYAATQRLTIQKETPLKVIKLITSLLTFTTSTCMAQVLTTDSGSAAPASWVDGDTGHRVVRLTSPFGPINNWYFDNNPFFPGKNGTGDLMVFENQVNGVPQFFTINLKTQSVNQITQSDDPKYLVPALLQNTREIIYQSNRSIYAIGIDTKQTRKLYDFSPQQRVAVSTINVDGTLLAGITIPATQAKGFKERHSKRDFFWSFHDAHPKSEIFVIDVSRQSYKVIHTENNWINHVQFSPVDPALLMFCREGPWEKVDRIWTLRTDTAALKLQHIRSTQNEIAGHEFFSPDGKLIWYDLQIPKNVSFYLASALVGTAAQGKRFTLRNKNEWSYHYNISPDQSWFAGDGNPFRNGSVGREAKWIYAYYPDGDHMRIEKLVNLSKHDYRVEPNVHISPDGKWVVFSSNFEGELNTYAVEVATK